MTWHKEKHRQKLCECGIMVMDLSRGRHVAAEWHQNYRRIDEMLRRGLSQAEVARQLGLSRMYLTIYLRKRRKAKGRR